MTALKLSPFSRTLQKIQAHSFQKYNVSNFMKAQTQPKNTIHTQTTSIMMTQSKVAVDNLQINFDRLGNGPHTVLCMPGALGCIESDFHPILHRFNTNKYTIITWDPPGCGKSRPPDRHFSGGIDYYLRDVHWSRSLMKVLGFDKYSILGWSDGATTAVIKASMYPASINKLVLWGGRFFITSDMVRNIDNWSSGMRDPLIKAYEEDYFRKCWLDWIAMNFEMFHKNGGDVCRQAVKKVTSPTLIIHGMKDIMARLEQAEFLKDNIIGSRLHIMPHGSHNLHIRCADEFVQMVEKFLNE